MSINTTAANQASRRQASRQPVVTPGSERARQLWCAQLAQACVEALRGRLSPHELRKSATAEAVTELFAHRPQSVGAAKVTGVRTKRTALGAWEVVMLLESSAGGHVIAARVIPRPQRRELAPGCRSPWVATDLRML